MFSPFKYLLCIVLTLGACEGDPGKKMDGIRDGGTDSADLTGDGRDTEPVSTDRAAGGNGGGGGWDSAGKYACLPGEPIVLPVTVRDFSKSGANTDFQSLVTGIGLELGVVKPQLGSDGKPVFNVQPNIYYTTFGGPENFAQWYTTDPNGVFNQEFSKTIALVEQADGAWVFDTDYFFPLGVDEGWGDEGDATGWNEDETKRNQPQNFRFTTEFHMQFTYEAGQQFSFRGDDDVWVFINGALVIDLGGIHGPEAASVAIDTLGLTPGEAYPMDIFQAERNPTGSNFRIETNIECFTPVIID